MPSTFTIDFFNRTSAYVASDMTPPRSGDPWTETLSHPAFCVARTFLNLDREDQIETARQFDLWLKNGFAEFPIHEEGSPGPAVPCGRFVSAYDGEAGSYVRSAYGFGLNARGLDYYGPMATAVLLRRMYVDSDRPDDLLQPVRSLCEFVLTNPIEEAGHVELVTSYVQKVAEGLPPLPHEGEGGVRGKIGNVRPADRKTWRNALIGAGLGLVLILGVSRFLIAPASDTDSVPVQPPPKSVAEKTEKPLAPSPQPQSQPVAPEMSGSLDPAAALPTASPRPLHHPLQQEAQRVPGAREQTLSISAQTGASSSERPDSGKPMAIKAPAPEPEKNLPPVIQAEKPPEVARVPSPVPTPAPERLVTGKDGAPMALIPTGEFVMGAETPGEDPSHHVFLEAYYMDRFEVTNARYLKFVEGAHHRTPQHYVDPLYDLWVGGKMPPAVADRPVVNVDWYDAAAYCRWAGMRLPTEAEWEKAARGTDGRIYPWGNEPPTAFRLNFEQKWAGPDTLRPVGSFGTGSSPYGVQDLAGNVAEWVSDWYDAGYYRVAPERDPRGPAAGSAKVLRGGSWTNHADTVRATARHADDPEARNSDIGFRCAQDYNAPAR